MDGSESCGTVDHDEEIQRIKEMPKEVGVLLIVAGIGGILLPGPVGAPLVVMGGVVLWPKAFQGIDSYLHRRFPKFHRQGVSQMNRFLADLERRYPLSK
jgi:hypothetical protein